MAKLPKKSMLKADDTMIELMTDMVTPKVSHCELCERTAIELTRHHLIPQSRHNKARTKREFSRAKMKTEIAMLCRPCHNQVHEIFSNQELSSFYHTVARLKEHTEIQKFIKWVKKRPSGQKIRVKSGDRMTY